MRVAMVDPLLFTLPYDRALCRELHSRGHSVTMLGRSLRPGESWDLAGVPFKAVSVRAGRNRMSTGAMPDAAHREPGLLRASWRRALPGAWLLRYGARSVVLAKVLNELRPDLIHFQWAPVPGLDRHLVRSVRRLAPCILTVHDTVLYNHERAARGSDLTKVMNEFDHLIVHTRQGIDRLLQCGIAPHRVTRIAHGPLHAATDAAAPRELKIGEPGPRERKPGDEVCFLLFGYMKPYKGIDVLIRAAVELPDEVRRRCRFVIAGEPHMDMGELEHLARTCGVGDRFEFRLGRVPEARLPRLFEEADAVVFPYREIEASGVLMLSLPFGRAVVASRIGVFDELLTDREHGYLVPPGDHRALARALGALAVNPDLRERMGDRVKALSCAVPAWSDIGAQTASVYEAVRQVRSSGLRPASEVPTR